MKRSTLLHITHTDVRFDSRILKELSCLSQSDLRDTYDVVAFGLKDRQEKRQAVMPHMVEIICFSSISKSLFPSVRILRHVFMLIEVIVRFLWVAAWKRPAVVHCHDTMVLPAAVAIKLLLRTKLVYDAHELETDRNGQRRVEKWLTGLVERFAWCFVDRFITVAPSIGTYYETLYGPKPTTIILNSPKLDDVPDDYAVPDYLRNQFNIASDAEIFVYLGIFGAGRGIEMMLEAFAELDDQRHLVFIGWGEYEALIREAECRVSNIHLHEAVSHERVVPIVRSADCGLCMVEAVSLSDYYCLPNKLFEYIFSGLPVICSDFPELSRVARDYGVGKTCELETISIRGAVRSFRREDFNFKKADLYDLSWQHQEVLLVGMYKELTVR